MADTLVGLIHVVEEVYTIYGEVQIADSIIKNLQKYVELVATELKRIKSEGLSISSELIVSIKKAVKNLKEFFQAYEGQCFCFTIYSRNDNRDEAEKLHLEMRSLLQLLQLNILTSVPGNIMKILTVLTEDSKQADERKKRMEEKKSLVERLTCDEKKELQKLLEGKFLKKFLDKESGTKLLKDIDQTACDVYQAKEERAIIKTSLRYLDDEYTRILNRKTFSRTRYDAEKKKMQRGAKIEELDEWIIPYATQWRHLQDVEIKLKALEEFKFSSEDVKIAFGPYVRQLKMAYGLEEADETRTLQAEIKQLEFEIANLRKRLSKSKDESAEVKNLKATLDSKKNIISSLEGKLLNLNKTLCKIREESVNKNRKEEVEIPTKPAINTFDLEMPYTQKNGGILAHNIQDDSKRKRTMERKYSTPITTPTIAHWFSLLDAGCRSPHNGRVWLKSETSTSKAKVSVETWMKSRVFAVTIGCMALSTHSKLRLREVSTSRSLKKKGEDFDTVTISNKNDFEPKSVFVALCGLEWDHRRNLRVNATPNEDRRKLTFSKWNDTCLYRVGATVISSLLPYSKLQAGALDVDHGAFESIAWNENVGRVRWKKIKVKFEVAFSQIPTVKCGFAAIDCSGSAARIKIMADNVTEEGFDCVVTTWDDTKVYWVKPTWLAHM